MWNYHILLVFKFELGKKNIFNHYTYSKKTQYKLNKPEEINKTYQWP